MAASFRLRQSKREAGGRPSFGTAALSLSDAVAAKVEAEACRPPSDVGLPVTHWSASLLGEHVRSQGIEISDRSVSRILQDADLQPHRQQMYLTSHDDEFRDKRDDILRVYYETPKHEHIVCVDEKTGIQALERRYADIAMAPGQPVRREFEYVRHGTLCWMGALDVRRGKPFGFVSQGHDSDTFVELLDLIDAVYPPGRGHIVMDNLSAHDTPDVNEWFDEHPRWARHFTPKHASWLNQSSAGSRSSRATFSHAARSRRPTTSRRRSTRTSRGICRPLDPSAGRTARSRGREQRAGVDEECEAAGERRRPDELQRGRYASL